MPAFSLVPVDHQPNFEDVSLVPFDRDPFGFAGSGDPQTPASSNSDTADADLSCGGYFNLS
jgi:hypothetical protein